MKHDVIQVGDRFLGTYLIGTGGWSHFRIPGLHPLIAYSKAFNFVEVNSTFYNIPPHRQIERWRRMVPPDFHFAVRAHRSITHKNRFQLTRETHETLEKLEDVCRILKAEVIHIQTPPSLRINQVLTSNLQDMISSSNLGRLRVALETRGVKPSQLPSRFVETMREYNIIHCVDLSKGETPAYKSDVLYSRLFGRGRHNVYQPTDEELREVDQKVSKSKAEKAILSFHFVRMYKDAARLKIYKQTGRFPTITKSTGISSLEEVLKEDVELPLTKQELMKDQGWKLFDLTPSSKIRVNELLERLPNRVYSSLREILDTSKPLLYLADTEGQMTDADASRIPDTGAETRVH